ncbi:MAG: FecR family protein [Devosia sp.]
MRRLIGSLAGAALALFLVTPVLAADSVGSARDVDPQAEAALSGATRTLVVGADVFMGDKITTGEKGIVQILFADNTKLVVGPKSALTIDEYLLRNDNTATKVAIDLLGGSFRFITGDSPKSAYEVNTPTGTIGVRGTKYDVYVDWKTQIAYAIVYQGQVILREDGGDTDLLTGLCHIGIIDTEETDLLGDSNEIFGEKREELKGWFRFSLDQSPLLNEFRVANASSCTRRPPVADTPESLVTGAGGCPDGQSPNTDGECRPND